MCLSRRGQLLLRGWATDRTLFKLSGCENVSIRDYGSDTHMWLCAMLFADGAGGFIGGVANYSLRGDR
jgi:hypothetical protein